MNLEQQSILEELKDAIDSEHGEEAFWITQNKPPIKVFGIFNLVDDSFYVKSKSNLSLKCAKATFSIKPSSVPGKEGDILKVANVSYVILPFKNGNFETIIPLKLKSDKDHNWR